MSLCDKCKLKSWNLASCVECENECIDFSPKDDLPPETSGTQIITNEKDAVNHPQHYAGNIECIDYIRDKLTPAGFTDYCVGNVMKYISRWRKKDGVQDLKKAKVYLEWAIENAEKEIP